MESSKKKKGRVITREEMEKRNEAEIAKREREAQELTEGDFVEKDFEDLKKHYEG